MGKMEFYVIWSVKDPPVQLNRKCSPVTYHTFLPSPLPEQLVVFGLGDWKSSCGTTVLAEVCVNSDVKPQKIGSLSPEVRCLVWDGEWRVDILLAVLKQADQGVQAQLVLTASGQDKKVGFTSTPSKNCFWAEPMKLPLHVDNISPLLPSDTISEDLESPDLIRDEHVKGQYSQPEVNEQINFTRSSPPSKKLYISVNGGDSIQAIKIKKFQEEEEIIHHSPAGTELVLTREKLIKAKSRLSQRFEGNGIPLKGLEDECGTWFSRRFAVCPTPRWNHVLCLSDPDTAILIGGEGPDHRSCTDSLWKLEIESDFWFPIESSPTCLTPQSSKGHSATYDPESKRIYIFGGIKEGVRYNTVHVLDTMSWKWSLLQAKGKIPTLAYHSAAIYQKELFVFGGLYPQPSSDLEACSNTLYIFNPEYELWYQPIVEGDKPLPRYGHSATLLRNKMVLFGGKRSSIYLNDLHILDLGFMEYTTVPISKSAPSPRCFHAAVPVADHKVLISGGCSGAGVLRDVMTFNIDTAQWSQVPSGGFSWVSRAGHAMINITSAHLTDSDKENPGKRNCCTLLVFGGSNCAGTFFDDTIKIQLDLTEREGEFSNSSSSIQ